MRQDEPKMGQGGMCGVTMPGTESLPQMPESPVGGSANGIAVEMQVRFQCHCFSITSLQTYLEHCVYQQIIYSGLKWSHTNLDFLALLHVVL